MVYDLTVNVKYKENCEFKQSSDTCTLQMQEQKTQCTLSLQSYKPITIGDKCIFIAEVTSNNLPVKIGAVTIYKIIIKEDKSIDEVPIATNCKVDNNGRVQVEYQPSNTGTLKFKAKYENIKNKKTQFFESSVSNEQSLIVNKINTKVTFINNINDHITNPKEQATLKVKVETNLSNIQPEPVTYGRVTFLYYENPEATLEENRIAHVIGNPVFLNEEGIAEIHYIPEQTFENLTHQYYENIYAYYNYNDDAYGKPWDFYDSSFQPTKVFINKKGITDIELVYHDTGNSIESTGYEWKHMKADDNIDLFITVYDESENQLFFNKDDSINIFIQGTRVSQKADYIEFDSYEKYVRQNFNFIDFQAPIIAANYDMNKQKFYTNLTRALGEDNKLSPGYYLIYASFDNKRAHNMADSIEEYVQSIDKSMIYYLQVDYEEAVGISITTSKDTYYTDINTPIEIGAQFNNLTSNQVDKLIGAPCTYHIPKINKTFKGKCYKDDDTLKIAPIDDIIINQYGTYGVYITINKSLYNGISVPQVYSNQATIKAIPDTLNPVLSLVDKTDYPGSITYQLNIPGIVNNTIEAHIYCYENALDKGTPIVQFFDDIITSFKGTFDNLSVGEYYIEAQVFVNETPITITIDDEPISINKSVIDYEIMQESKKVFADPYQPISLILSCSGDDFSSLSQNAIITAEIDGVESNRKDIRFINNKKNIIFTCDSTVISTENAHTVKLSYTDENFVSSEREVTFISEAVEPKYTIAFEKTDNDAIYKITLTNHFLDKVPIFVQFDDIVQCIAITNDEGITEIKHSDYDIDYNIWCNFSSASLYINPDATYEGYTNMDETLLNGQRTRYQEYGQEHDYDIWFSYYEESTKEYILGE